MIDFNKRNKQFTHELNTIKLHGKITQVLIPVYKVKQKKIEKPEILIKDK